LVQQLLVQVVVEVVNATVVGVIQAVELVQEVVVTVERVRLQHHMVQVVVEEQLVLVHSSMAVQVRQELS
jgi:hypothetical protein